MTAVLRSTAVGVFDDRQLAEIAVDELRRSGFRDEDIGFIVRNPAGDGHIKATGAVDTHVGEGVAAGALTGGAVGTLAGLAVAIGMIPAVGPVIAGGVLAGFLASVATGVAVGGVVGALVGLGIPEEEAGHYERELQQGRFLVTVKANDRYDEAVTVLRRHGAYGRGSPLI